MKESVPSTYKILADKALNRTADETWIDWAIDMVEAGFESENLYILAGTIKPYNQFELQDLTTKTLKDLQLDFSDKDQVIKNYVYFLITNSINRPDTFLKTLLNLKNLCEDLDFRDYNDFYLLYFAKSDLMEVDYQHYWEGAFKENIDQVINDKFIGWKSQFEIQKKKTIPPNLSNPNKS